MQDLEQFKNEMNLSGKNVYVGHRYVPKIFGEWDNTKQYEALSIVQYQGNSFTSRQNVPVGIEITNEDYWVSTGNYNAQIEQYRQDVVNVANDITNLSNANETLNDEITKVNDNIDSLYVNVNQFTGTDDREKIQNAIDYAYENGIQQVKIPQGDYVITSEYPDKVKKVGLYIPQGVSLEGINAAKTRIFSDIPLDTMILVENANISLKNFRIIGQDTSYTSKNVGTGIEIETPSGYLYIENVTVQGFNIGFHGSIWGSTFIKCSFQNNTEIGISLYHGTSTAFISVGVNGSKIGYKLEDFNYSTFSSSYGEQCDTAVHLVRCMSIHLTGFGSEFFNRILNVEDSINIEVDAIYAGAFGVGGSSENVYPYIFEFHDTEGGYFKGMNTQNMGKVGVTLFENVTNFIFNHGRILSYNNTYINSNVIIEDTTGLVSISERTFYLDTVNGDDNNQGITAAKPLKTLNALKYLLPKQIKHNYTVRLLNDVTEDITLEDLEIISGGSLTFRSHETSIDYVKMNNINIFNCVGRLNFDMLDVTGLMNINYSKGIVISRVNFTNTVDTSIRSLISDYEVQNSVFDSIIGLYLDRMSSVYVSNNTGTTTKWLHVLGSIVYSNGTKPTGSTVKTGGGQIFENV